LLQDCNSCWLLFYQATCLQLFQVRPVYESKLLQIVAKDFRGQMPFQSLNQQHQCTEWRTTQKQTHMICTTAAIQLVTGFRTAKTRFIIILLYYARQSNVKCPSVHITTVKVITLDKFLTSCSLCHKTVKFGIDKQIAQVNKLQCIGPTLTV